MANVRSEARLQASVFDIRRLLDRHRVLDTLAARQEGPRRGLLESRGPHHASGGHDLPPFALIVASDVIRDQAALAF